MSSDPREPASRDADYAHKLTSLMEAMFNDSFYHRNTNQTLLILLTSIFTIVAAYLVSFKDCYISGNDVFILCLISIFITACGVVAACQFSISHRRAGYSFWVIYRTQKALGYFDKGVFYENDPLIELPKIYDKYYKINWMKNRNLFNISLYAIGIRGYMSYALYVLLFSTLLNILILVYLLPSGFYWINIFNICIILFVIIYYIVRALYAGLIIKKLSSASNDE